MTLPLKLKAVGNSQNGQNKVANESTNNQSKGKVIGKGSQKGERLGLEFLKRLHELHNSGMPIAESVKLLNLRLSDPYQKEIAGKLWKELAEGRTLQEQ